MFIEYDWTSGVYRVRFGTTFTDWRGWRSFASLQEARDVLAQTDCSLKKTDTRTWEIVCNKIHNAGAAA